MVRKRALSLLLVAVLCAVGQLVTQAQTTTHIELAKSGNDVQLTMSVTPGPWRVVRSSRPKFNYQNALLAAAATTNPVTDANACTTSTLYFYDASDQGVGEIPADQGQPSQDNLTLTSLSPNSGWEGQAITISGTGFSTEPTADIVFFGPIRAVVTAATATSLTVTVPVGVMTGPVVVQVGELMSNSLPFFAAIASTYGGNTFQNISSIAFDSLVTQHLFFSDIGSGGTANYLYEIMDDYSITQRVFWNQIKGLPIDASGNLYFANTTLTSNAGLIKKCAAGTYTLTTYTNAKKYNETDSVSVVGLVYRPDGIIFAADRYHNSIRKRDPSLLGASDFVLGYTLDLYMGMAMDSTQNLYFTSGGNLYKTPTSGSSSVSTVATGFTNASGIAIDESTGNTLILIADRGAGSVYLLNAQTGLKNLITTGLNSPRAVAFGKDKITGQLYYYVAEPNRVLRLPDPRIKLDAAISEADVRVLISKKGSERYPCPLQLSDAQINIPFTVEGEINHAVTVYAYLLDPPDPSPYVTGTANDNRDPNKNGNSSGFQSLLSPSSILIDPATNPTMSGTFTLTITNEYAGDNYKVGLFINSLPPDPTKGAFAITGTITAWKRLYVERDKMFQQGGLLIDDAPGAVPNELHLQNYPLSVQPNLPPCANDGSNCFQIVLFDSFHPAESTSAQLAYVQYVNPDPANNRTILTLDRNILPPGGAGSLFLHTPGNFQSCVGGSAGVGVIGSGYYDPHAHNYHLVMAPAFCEVIYMTDFEQAIPYLQWPDQAHKLTGTALVNISKLWRNPLVSDDNSNSNYFHIIGMKNEWVAQTGDALAFTPTDANYYVQAASGIFEEAIQSYYPTQFDDACEAVADHEPIHNFSIQANLPDAYHCSNAAYSPPSDGHNCIMLPSPPVYASPPRLCPAHLLTGGDGITDCGAPLPSCNQSIRDQVDPLR